MHEEAKRIAAMEREKEKAAEGTDTPLTETVPKVA